MAANPTLFQYGSSNPYEEAKKIKPKAQGFFWKGADGKVYVQGQNGINAAGNWDNSSENYWSKLGFSRTADSAPTNNTVATAGGESGYTKKAPVLDQDQINSLNSLIGTYDTVRSTSKRKAALKRDASLNEKSEERTKENTKYQGKKISTLQDFNTAKTDTDVNTRNTLENLVSSLSTMGLGGSRALTRQVLDAANMANRKANATQAQNNQSLDSAWNDYQGGYENDVKKINDQFGYDTAEADRQYGQNKQNALYKIADVYNAADNSAERQKYMQKGNDLNSFIGNSAFVNPSYTG